MTTLDNDLHATVERYAPSGYDPASDDMTVPFAAKLAEQDVRIAEMKAAADRSGFFFFEHSDGTYSLNRK